MASGASSSAVTAVAFDIASATGQQLSRGQLQYSFDNGKTWTPDTLPVDASLATAAPLPHVTTLANGNFVIAWDSYVNAPLGLSTSDIFFQVYDSTGHALGAPTQRSRPR